MLKKLKLLTLVAAISGLFLVPLLSTGTAQAALFDGSKDEACKGASLKNTSCSASNANAAGDKVNDAIRFALNLLSMIVGIVAVIMIIVGGMKYVISTGDSSNVNSAKNTILYAVVGLTIAAVAQILVQFVIKKT